MTDDAIEKRRTNRLIVLNRIYEAAGGSTLVQISGPALLEDLGMPEGELADACEYLLKERLIGGSRTSWGKPIPFMMNLTHWGLKDLEKSKRQPDRPTERFPAFTVIHIAGDNLGPIQAGSPGASQTATVNMMTGLDAESLLKILDAYDAGSAELARVLPADDAAALRADMETVRMQAGSPKPNLDAIRGGLKSARRILTENATAGAVAGSYVFELLQHVHF